MERLPYFYKADISSNIKPIQFKVENQIVILEIKKGRMIFRRK